MGQSTYGPFRELQYLLERKLKLKPNETWLSCRLLVKIGAVKLSKAER